MVGIELRITRHKKIEKAIVIVVAPGRASRPAAEGYASLFRNIGKCAVVIVVIQTILAKVRYVNVRPAVIVEVSDRNAETPPFIGNPGFLCHLGECSVMVVVEK